MVPKHSTNSFGIIMPKNFHSNVMCTDLECSWFIAENGYGLISFRFNTDFNVWQTLVSTAKVDTPINSSRLLQISNAIRCYISVSAVRLISIFPEFNVIWTSQPRYSDTPLEWKHWRVGKNIECICEQFMLGNQSQRDDSRVRPTQCSLFSVDKTIHRSCIFISDHHHSIARANTRTHTHGLARI